MADENGDYASRFDRLEKIIERHSEQIGELIEHARDVDKRTDALRAAQAETNQAVKGLIGAIRDLIDRIPPENLR